MKHTSQLQQLHQLLASEQPGPTDSHGYGMKETNKTLGSLDLDDSSSSGVSSERDNPNSGRHPSRSHSDSTTSRDQSPDHSDACPCSSSGCSLRSDSFSVSSSSHDLPYNHTCLRPSCILAGTSTQQSYTNGNSISIDRNRIANFVTDDLSNSKTAVINSGFVKIEKNNKNEQDHEITMRNCLRDGNPSVAKHDSGADWAMSNFLSDICGDVSTDHPLKNHAIEDLHDYSFETLETSGRPDISDSQSVLSRNRHQIEIEQVHQVYNQIAPHCDQVRQKAWPRVKQFLKELVPGSLVADVGCGNGRYLMINPSIFKLGCDLCPPFLDQARGQGREVMIADNLALPFRDGIFDAVISIGVIHHFASLERRIMAISELSRILSPGGRLMVYVWAFEQVHRKFEGQDVLIPWVKPEVKGNAPRKSLSMSSESDNENHHSRSCSCSVDNTDGPSCGRRQRPECRLGSDGEKHRSKSLGDESSKRDVCRDFSIASGHCGSQTLGEFDQWLCKKREMAKQDSGLLENPASIDTSKHECTNGKDSEDYMKVSKWPGQLVSECKKLGKFLRSLSSRSISLGDGEADQPDFEEGIPDVYRNCQFYCNTNLGTDLAIKNTKDQLDCSRCGTLPDKNYDTKDTSNVRVNEFDQYKHTQDSYNNLCGPDLRLTTSCAAKGSDGNAPITMSLDAFVYHKIPASSSGSKYTSDSDAKVYQQTLSTSNSSKNTADSGFKGSHQSLSISDGSKFTTDAEPMNKQIHVQNAKSIFSQETVCPLHHEDKHFERIANQHIGVQSMENCFDETKVDIFNNHTQSLCDTDVEAHSESWTTVSNTESVNSEDPVSSHSDTTIMESQFSSNTNIPAQGRKDLQKPSSTQGASIRCGDAPKTPLDSHIETTACVSMGIIHESVNVQGLNKCLPICQNKFHSIESESSYLDLEQLDETSNHGPCRCSTTSVVAEGLSEMSGYTDHPDSSSALSLDRGRRVDSTTSTVQYNIFEAMSESHVTKYNSGTLDYRCIDTDDGEIYVDKAKKSVFEPDKMMLQETQRKAVNDEGQNLSHSTLSQEVIPYRGTLKSFLNKLANYFRPHSKAGSNKFGCYHNGNGAARKFLFESESSDFESPVSSFSTHSSCYPGLFAMSKERDNCEKVDCISETVPHKYETGIYDDDFDITNKVREPADDNRTNTDTETEKLKLSISVLNTKQNCRQDFVNDVSIPVVKPTKETYKNVNEDAYVFKVENISQVPVKKASFLNNISQKWSGLFGKRSRDDSRKPCLNYSTASVSSSSDGNEEHLKISLTDNESLKVSKVPPQKRPLVRRPNSLDFNKKRTRRSGRRPAPRKENTQSSIDLDRVRRIQEQVPLSLSDAMTLLGDGVDEENIIKRLDIPAKTIFAEMKRINFAMRKFPMSSLGNSSSKEDITKEAENTENVHYEVTNTRQALKMRRDKKMLTTNRGFSESVAAQDIIKSRRQLFQANKEVDEIDLTNIPCLDKKCISEDFGISLDILGGHIHKSKCQVLYSCNSDSTQDLSALLESSPEMQNDSINFQTRTNNAQVLLEDKIRSHTFRNIQQENISTTHHGKKIVHGNTVDTENKKVAGIDLTHIHCMDRKCISEDFGVSFDMLRGQIHKSKCQLLYSCSSDSKEDLSALLESSSEMQQDSRQFQNRTNNAQVSLEDTIGSDKFGNIQQGNISTRHHAKKILHGNTVDTEKKKVVGIDLTHIHCMDRKCISEDFGISFDMLRGQIHKSKCQLLYSCSSDSKQDLSALLESSSEIREDPKHFQNRTNNAQVSPEETIRSDTFGNIKHGNISTIHHAKQILHGNTVDTEKKKVAGIDLTHIHCMDRKCISEDFGISFDMLRGHIHKSKCQLLYSCSSDSKEDLSALLESSSEMQQDPIRFQNRSNNPHISLKDRIRSDTFGEIENGAAVTTHRTQKLLDRNTADTECKSLSKYVTRMTHHSAESVAIQSDNTPRECNPVGHHFDEVTEVTTIKDGCSNMGNNIKITLPGSLSGNNLPLKAMNHILKPKQTRRSNKHRTLENQQATESKVDNSLSRYYHVFKQGELDQLVTQHVPSLRIVDTFYDHANWCVIAEKLTVP